MWGNLSPLIVLTLLAYSVAAVYEDQAGKYDWSKQHVGTIKLVRSSSKPQAIYVASEGNVIASLSGKDGSVRWRQILDETDTISRLVVGDGAAITVSSGTHLRVFGDTGAMRWEAHLQGQATSNPDVAITLSNRRPLVVAGSAGTVTAFDFRTGTTVWSKQMASKDHSTVALHVDFSSGDVNVAMMHAASGEVVSARLSAMSGEVIGSTGTAPGSASLPSGFTALSSSVLSLSADASKVCIGSIGSSDRLTCQRVQDLAPGSSAKEAALLPGTCPEYVVLQTSSGAALLHAETGKVKAVSFQQGATGSGCFLDSTGSPAFAAAKATPTGVEAVVISGKDGSEIQRAISPSMKHVTVSGGSLMPVMFVHAVPSSTASGGARVMVQLEEGTCILMAPDGTPMWKRYEALSSVTHSMFVDLPAPTPEIEAQWAAQQPSLSDTLHVQLLTLKQHFGLATPEEQEEVQRYVSLTSDKLRPFRDPDGFRKQLIVTTAAGKVASLHSGDGRVLWSLDFGAEAAPQKLAPWRTPHDATHDAEILAIHADTSGVTLHVLDARTGVLVSSKSIPMQQSFDIISLPHSAHDGRVDQHVYLVLPLTSGKVQIFPNTPLAQEAFTAQAPITSYWRVDNDSGAIKGYSISSSGSVSESWSIIVAPPATGSKILAVAASDAAEAVYSYGRPLPGGAVRLKHLSPNTVLVVAGPETAKAARTGSARLTAWVIDAVTGRVLTSQQHEDGSGPVAAVVSEHWAAYHYWNPDIHRHQVSVIELYRSQEQPLRVVDMVRGKAVNETMSVWSDIQIEVERQTYFSRLAAVVLSTTKTRRGVTAKQLLVGTPFGQIYQVDRRMLDPRRPIVPPDTKPTKEHMAEGLPPYQPELPMTGISYATQDKFVPRLRDIICIPAALESTSLMAAVGLDLYFTRLSPSRGFDMVPDDFPAALLVVIMGGMVAGLSILRAVLTSKALKIKWQ